MSGRVYLGFDPGMSGAIAGIYAEGHAVVFDMPTVATVLAAQVEKAEALAPQPRRRRKVAGGQAELTLEEGRS